ncbi:MAG: amidohydrolase [Pseudomonadales bacterium]
MLITVLAIAGCGSHHNDEQTGVSTVYINGEIYTLNAKQPWAAGLAVTDGRLVGVGSNEAVLAEVGPNTEVVDLGGRFVMPGLQDAHVHTQMIAEFNQNLSTDPDRSWQEIAEAIRQYAADNADKDWILGGNLPWLTHHIGDNADVPAHFSTLDELVSDQAIALWDVGGHAMLANSRALELAGIAAETPDPVGGTIERDASGQPTGVLRELATSLIVESATALSVDQYAEGMAKALSQLSAFGITSINEVWTFPTTLKALKQLADDDALHMRVVVSLAHPVEFVTPEAKQAAREVIERRVDFESELLQVRYVKFVLDGSAGGQTLVLIDPYIGTDFTGELRNPAEVVMAEVARLQGEGIGSVIHAVGDGAVRLALDAVEKAVEDHGNGVRQVISHTVFVNPEDLARFKKLGVIAEFSPYFWHPNEGAEILREELGEHRLNWAFPMRAIVDDGNHVSAGSDWPVVFDPNPFPAIETMVTRERPGGSEEAFGRQHGIKLEEALQMFTLGSAYELYQEDSTGSLEAGKHADFIVLDRNLLKVPIREVHATRVLQTVLGGEVIYDRAAPAGSES